MVFDGTVATEYIKTCYFVTRRVRCDYLIIKLVLFIPKIISSVLKKSLFFPFSPRYLILYHLSPCERRGSLMVSALDSGASGLGSSPGRGHCVVFLGKTLHFHGAPLYPDV